jgi:hypothetical protein
LKRREQKKLEKEAAVLKAYFDEHKPPRVITRELRIPVKDVDRIV